MVVRKLFTSEVEVYYSEGAVARAIAENNFACRYGNVRDEDIPMVGSGQVRKRVSVVAFNIRMINAVLLDQIIFVDPLTALLFAKKYPKKQEEATLVILFHSKSKGLCFLSLDHSQVSGRGLLVNSCVPIGESDEKTQFLVYC